MRNIINIKIFISYFLLILIFNFPKGGIKIEGIPFTWGYFIIFFLFIFSIIRFTKIKIPKINFFFYICTLPFLLLVLSDFFYNGISGYPKMNGYFLSFLINISFFPLFFLIFSNHYIELAYKHINYKKLFVYSIRFLSIFGIVSWIIWHLTGRFIEIPFLTINGGDYLADYILKHIMRGENNIKLVSTFNNGSIFGLCLLMFIPIYFYIEKKLTYKFILLLTIFLIFSRTLYVMFFIYIILIFILNRLNFKNLIYLIISLASFILIVILINYFSGYTNLMLFFHEPVRGKEFLMYYNEFSLFGNTFFQNISDVLYAGILYNYGIVGLIFFLLSLSSPLFVYFFVIRNDIKSSDYLIPIKDRLALGTLLYLIAANIDNHFNAAPIMLFYWFIISILFFKN